MGSIITSFEQVTPSWLSAELSEAGVPGAEHLISIYQRPNPAFNSQITHLELEYKTTITADSPSSLLIKLSQHGDGETEVLFYQQAAQMKLPGLVHCFAAKFDEITGNSFLLLQDISNTHQPPVTRQALLAGQGVPDQSVLICIAESLANFHATFWERQLPGRSSEITGIRDWYSGAKAHSQHYLRRKSELNLFLSRVGKDISPETCSILKKSVEQLPYLWEEYLQQRVENYRQITLAQGDCYMTQFLIPRQTESGPTYLVDFDSVSGNFPAYDLVYLLPTFWNRTQRLENARELRFLQHYHTILCQSGVKDYCFADLCQDYRLLLCYMLLDAPADQVRGSSPAYWQPKLRCLVEAYQDWECESL